MIETPPLLVDLPRQRGAFLCANKVRNFDSQALAKLLNGVHLEIIAMAPTSNLLGRYSQTLRKHNATDLMLILERPEPLPAIN